MAKTQTSTTPRKSRSTKAADANAVKVNLEKPSQPPHEPSVEQRMADRRANDIVKADAMQAFVNQQNGLQPQIGTPPAAMEDFQKKLEALKAEYGVTADVKVKAPKADKKVQNDVTRPADNTACGKIWATADAISLSTHGICPIAALKEHADMKGVNDHTIKTQYAKWRKYNGVVGRLPKLHAVHQVQGEYAGLTPVVPPKAE
jgi:hypothetical protein